LSEPATASKVAIIVLAAGAARRYGSAKQLAALSGVSLVRRAAQAALEVSADVVVVTGAYDEAVSAELADLPLRRCASPDWVLGLGHSLAAPFRAGLLSPECSALILLADQPLIGSAQLRALLAAHHTAPDKIIAADYGERLGPPCLFPPAFHAELAELSGDRGARPLLQRHAAKVLAVPMPEAAIDIDTPDDWKRLTSALP